MTKLDLERAISNVDRLAEAAIMEIERGEYEAAKVTLKVIREQTKVIQYQAGIADK